MASPRTSGPTGAANTVGAIMTRKVVTISPDDTAADVKRMLESRRLHHLVVVGHGRVMGLVSDRDLSKCLSPFIGRRSEREQDASSLNRKVHQIMTRHVPTCRETNSIAAAGQLLLDKDVLCLPVVDAEDRCVGIVTSHDLLAWCMVRCAGAADSCAVPRAA